MQNDIENIYRTYHKLLMSFIIKRVPNRFIAEDILQEVFIKILNNHGQLRNQKKLKSWLFQITRNSIIDYYRQEKHAIELEEETVSTIDHQVDDTNVRLQLGVLGMLQQLPLKYRQSLFLADYKGLTHKEIAAKLNISLASSKVRVQRARRSMKEIYLKCCHFEFDRNGKVIDYYPH